MIDVNNSIVRLNTNYFWTTFSQNLPGNQLDVESILAHEIGHIFGVAHPLSSSYSNNSTAPTMAGGDASYHWNNLSLRSLESADIEATQFLQFGVPFNHTTIQTAISAAQSAGVSNVFVVDQNNLTADVTVPSGITLNLLGNSSVDLNV